MKNEKKLQVLCEQLPYGLMCLTNWQNTNGNIGELKLIGIHKNILFDNDKGGFMPCGIETVKPILHEMDLTKKITIGGETFVPLDKIASLRGFAYWNIIKNPEEPGHLIIQFRDEDDSTLMDEFKPMVLNFSALYDLPFFVIECFKKWHMNYLAESDYVKVSSLPKSPYA